MQIAKLLGASHVAGVCSSKNSAYGRSLGADSVVEYDTARLAEALQKEWDVVFDCVGGKEQWEEAQKVLKVSGRFVTIVGDDKETKITAGALLSVGSALVGRKLTSVFSSQHHHYVFHMMTPHSKWLDRVAEWMKEGKLKVNVQQRFEFSEQGVKELYAQIESGRTVGKLVMEVIKDGEEKADSSRRLRPVPRLPQRPHLYRVYQHFLCCRLHLSRSGQ